MHPSFLGEAPPLKPKLKRRGRNILASTQTNFTAHSHIAFPSWILRLLTAIRVVAADVVTVELAAVIFVAVITVTILFRG